MSLVRASGGNRFKQRLNSTRHTRSPRIRDDIAHLFKQENRPKNITEFKRVIEEGLGSLMGQEKIVMADCCLTPGHIGNLQLAWMLFHTAQGRTGDGTDRLLTEEELAELVDKHLTKWLLHGPRGGSKTFLIAAVIMLLCIFVDDYGCVHAAAVNDQSERIIEYLTGWIVARHSPIRPLVKGKPLKTKIVFKNGSFIRLTTGGTIKGVNSKHCPWLSYDEVELAPYSVLQEAVGIPQGQAGRNLPAMVIFLSTQKEPGMSMSLLIKRTKGPDADLSYAKWNWLEIVERCPDFRTKSLPLGLSCSDHPALTTRLGQLENLERALTTAEQGEKYLCQAKLDRLNKNCKLVPHCQGKAKHANGFMPIDTVKTKLSMGLQKFLAQMQCIRPSPEGLVYPNFTEENCDVRARQIEGANSILICDPGYSADPTAILGICEHDGYYDAFFEHTIPVENKLKTPKLADLLEQMYYEGKYDLIIVDNQAGELCDTLVERGVNCERAAKPKTVEEGVSKVAACICDEKGFRQLRFAYSCVNAIECMWHYKRNRNGTNIPRQKVDHFPDCVRYGIWYFEGNKGDGGVNHREGEAVNYSR